MSALAALAAAGGLAGAAVSSASTDSSACPWLTSTASPSARAAQVLAKMTTEQKSSYVGIDRHSSSKYENYIPAIRGLCLPSLRLEDGPAGVAWGEDGVTQMPAPIDLAAAWDPSLAESYGQAIGAEAVTKGISVLQGPNLSLARVPESGRSFEGLGEDPMLDSQIGDAEIDGIQSTGEIAEAKHFGANNQETGRVHDNERIPQRSLRELYLPAFESAVRKAHVGSIMCAFGRINGSYSCASHSLLTTILRKQWGFKGDVRADWGATPNLSAAIDAGDDMVKPVTAAWIAHLVARGSISMSALNAAVLSTLRMMFQFKLITGSPRAETPDATATTRAHRLIAQQVAEAGTVLLQNRPVNGQSVLPIARTRTNSIGLIGAGAWSAPDLNGGGSSAVNPTDVITPLQAIAAGAAHGQQVRYAAGTKYSFHPVVVNQTNLTTPNAEHPGLIETITEGSKSHSLRVRGIDDSFGTASAPDPPAGTRTGKFSLAWKGYLVASRSGSYRLGLDSDAGGTISLDGEQLATSSSGNVSPVTVNLQANKPVSIEASYTDKRAGGHVQLVWGAAKDPGSSLGAAESLAGRSKIAIVVVHDVEGEGFDRHSLRLPDRQNQLIEAVAQRNPRTVVVLDTGGAVLMPWLHKVAAVVQTWYPGEMDGAALEAVLSGSVDPSGKLPISFPKSEHSVATSKHSQFPGSHGVIDYSEGLDVGYRWYDAKHVKPLFPFGYGLSYTRFSLSRLTVHRAGHGSVLASASVRNAGGREGSTVVQFYVRFPRKAHEPPEQLKAFRRVQLRAGRATRVRLRLPKSAFEYWSDRYQRWQLASGGYEVSAGQSSADLTLHKRVPFKWLRR